MRHCVKSLMGAMTWMLFACSAYAQKPEQPAITAPKLSKLNASIFRYLYESLGDTFHSIYQGIISLGDFVEMADWLYHSLTQESIRVQVYEFSMEFMASLVIALAIERFLSTYMKPLGNKFRNIKKWQHFWRDFCNVAVCLFPILMFGLSFYMTFRLMEPVGFIYLKIATIFINGVTGTWALIRSAHLVLRPHTKDSHIPFEIDTLHKTYLWLRRIAFTTLVGYFTVEIGNIISLPQAGHKLVIQLTTLIIVIFGSNLVWALNDDFRQWLRRCRKRKSLLPWKKRFLALFHFLPITIVYTITLSYLSWVLPLDPVLLDGWKFLGTLFLLPILFYAQHLIELLQKYWMENHLALFAPELYQKVKFYQAQVVFVFTSIIALILILFAIWLWGGDPLLLILSPVGQEISEKALSILMIIGLSLFFLRFIKGGINKYLTPSKTQEISDSEKARMNTLRSISLNIAQIIVLLPAVLLILAELDIDILPAVATLSVLGVGLSFGIQSLVKDFVTGLFMLIEDSFAVGDTVNINGKVGHIESLAIRVLRLRAMDGSLSSIPYGGIDTVANYTRVYSVAVVMITFARGEDVEKVYRLIKQLDSKLQEKNEEVQNRAIEPILIDGVTEVTGGTITIRARIKTTPNGHWKVKRIYEDEIAKLLDSKGIKRGIPLSAVIQHPTQTQKK